MSASSPEELLAQMDALMPWHMLAALTEGHDDSGRLTAMARLLRLHIVQQVQGLSDDALEAALRESPTLRRFAGIDEAMSVVPDASARAEFRALVRTEPLALGALSRYMEPPPKPRPPAPRKPRGESAATRKSYVWRFAGR